jgi:transcriptional regulator of acetoin/glycerol metabolism
VTSGLHLSQADSTLWQQFVEQRTHRSQDPVLERWARVRALGVRPAENTEPVILGAQRIAECRERMAPVLDVAYPLLADSAAEFADRHFTLLLADADGVVVDGFSGGDFEPTAQQSCLIQGAAWNEAVRGTNAIGTAVAEGAPVVVEGFAHWERRNHRLSCYASPILTPDGRVVGVVDATSFSSAPAEFVQVAVSTLARAVGERLRARAFDESGSVETISRALQHVLQAAFVIEHGARVRMANPMGRRWLSTLPDVRATLTDVWRAVRGARSTVELPDARLTLEPVYAADGTVLASLVFVGASGIVKPRAAPDPFARLVGDDRRFEDAKQRAARFAKTELPVLLQAETGTGKDLLARAVHDASGRRDGPYVALNCGALSESLLESELFGYGPGAFTGARPDGAVGKLEAATGGTLFLDEVAEMPPRLQAVLLRVLEDGWFHRVGEIEPRRADFRLITATCEDLVALVASGAFRQDLFFRIRGANVELPPLRERTDLVMLARALLAELSDGRIVPVDEDALTYLRSHEWPGNVRELRSALAHAYALDAERIRLRHFPTLTLRPRSAPTSASLKDSEAEALDRALAASGGNMSDAARRLGVARSTLYRMMKRHGRR